MGRKILAVISGLLTGLIVILLIRTMSLAKYPFPADLDWTDGNHRDLYIASLPDAAFIIVIASHMLGAFLAGLIASLVCRYDRFSTGIIAALLIFAFVLVANFTHEYPKLYMMIDVLLTAVAGFAGAAFGRQRVV